MSGTARPEVKMTDGEVYREDFESFPPGIERVFFTEEQVDARIAEVAGEIARKYEGREVKLIGVLKGSVFFLTALARD